MPADERLAAIAHSLQQQIDNAGHITDTAVSGHILLIPVQQEEAVHHDDRDSRGDGQVKRSHCHLAHRSKKYRDG